MSELLVKYVRDQLYLMHSHRTAIGLDTRLRECLQQRVGMYDSTKLAQIRSQESGSEIFLQMTAAKCRAAAAMLTEIYVTGEKPWSIEPTPVPDDEALDVAALGERARAAVQSVLATGVQVDQGFIESQITRIFEEGMRERRELAARRVAMASDYLNDMLEEGGFNDALGMFIEDFVTYPLAVMAGPRAVMQSEVDWEGGQPKVVAKPRLRWSRVDPGDFWWTPSARDIAQADVIERMTVSRSALEAMQGMPGYDAAAVRQVLDTYGEHGYRERVDNDNLKSDIENRPNDHIPYSSYDLLLFTGRLTGAQIKQMQVPARGVSGASNRSWLVSAIVCGDYLIKVHLDPDPLQRVGYFVASYEPVPNSIVGRALPEIFRSAQGAVNAISRAMLNNVAMASGPQVVVNVDAMADPGARIEQRPWKHWLVSTPMQASAPPVVFFQPPMNGQELASLLTMFWAFADEVSGVPRYLGGNERVGGAGRTASGLAMLMGNSTRVMQSIAHAIDKKVLEPALAKLHRMLMLVTPGDSPLRGDDRLVIKGATYARAREGDRMRMLELLSLSANPIDMQILGPEVRADLLLRVARNIGLDIPEGTLRDVLERAAASRQMGPQGAPPAPGQMPGGPMPGGAPGGAPGGPVPGSTALSAGAGQQMPPAAGLANPGVDMDTRAMLAARGVNMGPLSRRG